MCLGIPMKIIEINNENGLCEFAENRILVSLKFLPDTKIGDYVIVHAGFAIQKLAEKDAKETIRILKDLRVI